MKALVIMGVIALIVVALGLAGSAQPATVQRTATGTETCRWVDYGAGQYVWTCTSNRPDFWGAVNRIKVLACLMFGPCTSG